MADEDQPAFKGIIDMSTFEQILEMDDEGDMEFSSGIVYGFFEQADSTFEEMQAKLKDKDLGALSSLGHFLKGSSATLGLTKVKDGCEKIQHYGAKKDDSGEDASGSDEEFLRKIEALLPRVKQDYKEAEKALKSFYGRET